ncbi:MAG: hypothetical protein QN173_10780 [Armatimonadota bacterium]|nr:hypothetical protein [Armatimonadota bacterium]MDR7438144.1 hypothetical protein [Armatimonadota bacterium]MDR7471447.1 hypothetical protein [Armatimonadota bacterium]MDR7508076.1 hypothetical protein [Armatimonadota bacterium]MDR7510285.1 hypothetical protein [Armatimonadota bacterium]
MFFATHLATGLALGRRIRPPAAACAAGIVSHLVLDRTPHWDAFNATVSWTTPRNLLAVLSDVTAAALVATLARRRRWICRGHLGAAWGALGAMLPDLLWVPYHVLGVRRPRWVFDYHGRIQRPARWGPSLLVQVALVALSLWRADRNPHRC